MSWSIISELLSKLVVISPMPSDKILLENENDLADRYSALVEKLTSCIVQEKLDPEEERELITVLADSFGLGGGGGIYWESLHIIEKCTPHITYPIIQNRVLYGFPGSRYWCCFILGRRRNMEDLPLFLDLLQDNISEIQNQALHSLIMLSQEQSLSYIIPNIQPLTKHSDLSVRKTAQKALEQLSSKMA